MPEGFLVDTAWLKENGIQGTLLMHYGRVGWLERVAPALVMSTLERAILEFLDELPHKQDFEHASKLFEGLTVLKPPMLQNLLEHCNGVKVKRLFFHFADRHKPQWLEKLDRSRIDLGSGPRMVVRDGKYDPTNKVTVPYDAYEDLKPEF